MLDNIKHNKDYDFGSAHGYKVKGLVSDYIEIFSVSDARTVLNDCKKNNIKVLPCGGGSNTLIRNKFDGVFIKWLGTSISILEKIDGRVLIKVGSACKKSDFNDFCSGHGFSGVEFWSGIPGCVGGGVAMNAGAYGKEIKDVVHEVFCVSDAGATTYKGKDLKWSYRKVSLPKDTLITDVTFDLIISSASEVKKLSDSYIDDRENKHPLEYPSCGSVFKNPDTTEHGAWWYIKEAGLSGYSIGGAKVSEKHSNFIINAGNATADDVIQLISHIKNTVKKRFGVLLEEEVRIF